MKNIKIVTITGADDSVDQSKLFELAELFPFVEFAILIRKDSNTLRYPSFSWIKKLSEMYESNKINLSVHLCGSWVRDICKGNWSILENKEFMEIFQIFQRIQLNFSPYVRNIDRDVFIDSIISKKELENKQIIFQLKNINDELFVKAKENNLNVVPLFDISGGNGLLPESWPFSDEFCGYAGGLNPDNVENQINEIMKVSSDIWIDVESGIRTDNIFDLEKVKMFLQRSSPYVNIV